MRKDAFAASRRIIAVHYKSFAFASRLLPPAARDRAVIVYAWCRRADDAADHAAGASAHAAVAGLHRELDAIYAGNRFADPILGAFQEVTCARRIPRHYPQELLAGLVMDVDGTRYETMPELLRYCYRGAGLNLLYPPIVDNNLEARRRVSKISHSQRPFQNIQLPYRSR